MPFTLGKFKRSCAKRIKKATSILTLKRCRNVSKYRHFLAEDGVMFAIAAGNERGAFISYEVPADGFLAELCDKYGADKGSLGAGKRPYGWAPHTYTDYYSLLFDNCRNEVRNVFECGIGTVNPKLSSSAAALRKPGASLRVWRDYFPNAEVIGADIDEEILFQEDRIKTYWLDQTSPKAIKAFWEKIEPNDFDMILDDGLHTFEAGVCLFENSIHKLGQRGYYIIEDVRFDDVLKYQQYFKGGSYVVQYVMLFKKDLRPEDNNLVVIRKLSA